MQRKAETWQRQGGGRPRFVLINKRPSFSLSSLHQGPQKAGLRNRWENESFMFYMLNNKSKPYSSSEGNFSGALCLAPKSPEDQPVLFGTIFPITAKEVEYVAISRIWTKCRIRMSQPSAGQFSPALVSCPCLMSGITITWISATAAVTQCTTFLHNVFSSTTAIIWCTYMYSSTVEESQANFASQSCGCSASSYCIE